MDNWRECPAPRKSSVCATPAVKLKNISTKNDTFDTLCYKAPESYRCNDRVCQASLVSNNRGRSGPHGTPRLAHEVLSQAKDFLDEYYTSIKRYRSPGHVRRWEQVESEVSLKGTYELTETELVYGSKLAWRNAERCIGRIQWTKLQVFDARYVTTAGGMFEAVCNHIKYGTNKGNIRSAITIFPQRTDGKHDYRIWNSQLIGYAAYRLPDDSILGDPGNFEFTEVCQKLGWKGRGGRWDILPLVVSAAGHDPEYFELPEDLILQVPIEHPRYEWFYELDLRWYALPAVSNMLFDVGGVEFPATPFNGWYMSTEIACRDLADTARVNVLEQVARGMDLDTSSPASLWKDRSLVELNIAVLHSFQMRNVTIVDHHTAAESFMKHLENESRLRGGCPADWVWIVPPLSSSLTPVFHQEMLLYTLKPSYEYQEHAWKTHQWKKGRAMKNRGDRRKSTRKFRFREIARAVKFTSKLFGKAMSRRIKATVLYATETGKSEGFAKTLCTLFNHAFNAQVVCLADYDVISLEHETIVLVVTSTFGNGDPPENGEDFAKKLCALKMNGNGASVGHTIRHSKSFIKKNSLTEMRSSQSRESSLDHGTFSDLGPLSNVRFAVFALGSSAYPNFCAFGAYVDKLLGELGGERLSELKCGDELCGQQQAFLCWARDIFRAACDVLCVGDDSAGDLTAALMNADDRWEKSKVRIVTVDQDMADENTLQNGLSKAHNRTVVPCRVVSSKPLHKVQDGGHTVQVTLDTDNIVEMTFQPGDHLGVCPANRVEIVDGILGRLTDCEDPDQIVNIETLQEQQSINGTVKTWVTDQRIPPCSVRTALSRYLDISSPPSHQLLRIFSLLALDAEERARLALLAADTKEYEDWKHTHYPTLLEVLEEFGSVKVETSLLMTQVPLMQPRFYSISSSPSFSRNEIQLTVAVVQFRTKGSSGPLRYGVCSNYLATVGPEDLAYCFVRGAPNFRLAGDLTLPVIMVGPGTGIAPFRSFWQERRAIMEASGETECKIGPMTLYFGCRLASMHLYRQETEKMVSEGVIHGLFTAYSREPSSTKRYVQELLMERMRTVYQEVYCQKGHMYVCGDVSMAEDVCRTLRNILRDVGEMTAEQADAYVLAMRDENRYHEDIFGVTFRTAEVRAAARSRITA